MEYLEQNLAALARRQPDLAQALAQTPPHPEAVVEPAKSGDPALRLGGLRLTSAVDPAGEGRRLAAAAPPGPLVALGFGLGYHLQPLADRDILVWEPDPGLLRAALAARDLSDLLPRLRLAVGQDQLGDLDGRASFLLRPSARLHPQAAQFLGRRGQAPAAPSGPRPARPRVLVIPPLLGGTLAQAYWCAEALTDLGCQVRTVPMEKMSPLYKLMFQAQHNPERLDRLRAPMMRFLGELAVLKAEEFGPHLVLALAQAPLDRRALTALKSQGARTAFWFVEDHRQMVYFREVAASYDLFLHIQGPELMAELDRLGANHAFLPCAAHPAVHRPLSLTELDQRRYGGQVGFMGAGYPNRRRVFADLVAGGLPLKLWGVDWPTDGPLGACLAEPNRYLDTGEVVKIYNACRIVLNLHSSVRAGTGAGGVDFVNPRTLEVPACGGFQLVDRVRGLERMLVPGREVAVFEDERDLLEKTRHYLDHPEEAARLAQAGRRRVLAEHTYHHRLEELLTRALGPGAQDEDGEDGLNPALEMMLDRLAAQAA